MTCMPDHAPPPRGHPLRVLVHARSPALWATVEATLTARGHTAIVAFSYAEGIAHMERGGFDRIFVGMSVPHDERLGIMAHAATRATSVIEITHADTVVRELMRHEMSGAHPRLPT